MLKFAKSSGKIAVEVNFMRYIGLGFSAIGVMSIVLDIRYGVMTPFSLLLSLLFVAGGLILFDRHRKLDFPRKDENGERRLRIIEDVKLGGCSETIKGINPQSVLPDKKFGQDVYFLYDERKDGSFDVIIRDFEGRPLGYLPHDFPYREDIAARMQKNITVLGKILRVTGGKNGKPYRAIINIARYS